MKGVLFLCLFFGISTLSLHSLESWFIGLGAEANAHTREGVAAGGGPSFGMDINRNFSLGLKAAFSHNFDTVAAVEIPAFFRYYLPLGIIGPFVQAEAGTAIYFEHGSAYPAFSGGLALGWRFVLGQNMYIEPLLRGGYPFAWGAGLTAGIITRKENHE
jgi:hypothetical protein